MDNIKLKTISRKSFLQNKQHYAEILSLLASSVGQDPGEHVYDWLDVADTVLIATDTDEDKVIGFSTYKLFEEDDVIHIPATMILKEYQRTGIAKHALKLGVKKLLLLRIKKLKNIFKPIFIVFRTQNPSLYRGLYKKIDVYPNPDINSVPEDIKNLGKKYANILWPESNFDVDSFVLKKAYSNNPNLAMDPEKVPWSNDKKIDNFFIKTLALDKKSPDALFVIGKIKISTLLKS